MAETETTSVTLQADAVTEGAATVEALSRALELHDYRRGDVIALDNEILDDSTRLWNDTDVAAFFTRVHDRVGLVDEAVDRCSVAHVALHEPQPRVAVVVHDVREAAAGREAVEHGDAGCLVRRELGKE